MFLNREEAGIRLALKLSKEKFPRDSIIVSIPRGGVVVGKTISEILGMALQVLLVKKVGAPQNPELAIGATGSNGVVYWDEKLIEYLGISDKEKDTVFSETVRGIKAREKRLGIEPLKRIDLKKKTIIVVDDGVATGATAITAFKILKKLGSKKIVMATPVISGRTKKELRRYFDRVIAVETPHDFQAVGQFYQEFPQVEDEEVKKILNSK
mgnify:CR=1 FL=1